MKVEMNESGCLDITGITMEQISLFVHALKESPNQDFMNDHELGKMFKLMAIMQSDVFEDIKSGKVDITKFKPN